MEVYYYVPVGEADFAVECGLKLSSWYDREVPVFGIMKKCMSALLNPKDDMEKFMSEDYTCLKLEVSTDCCFIADRCLFETGLTNPDIMKKYYDSIMYANEYIFGFHRLPECLVATTVIGGSISILDKRIDSPVIVDNSQELYVNNIIENHREIYKDFNDTLLYCFYNRLAEKGKFDRIEGKENRMAVFTDKESGRTSVIKVPSNEGYPAEQAAKGRHFPPEDSAKNG